MRLVRVLRAFMHWYAAPPDRRVSYLKSRTPTPQASYHTSLIGRGTQSRVGVRARRGGLVEIFLDTPPHMRGGVTPPLRGGRHLMVGAFKVYSAR